MRRPISRQSHIVISLIVFAVLILIANVVAQAQSTPIGLVQHANKDAGSVTSSSLAFSANNTAGNFIAVVVRAGKSNDALTVSDSQGNTYRPAVQFNVTVDSPTGDTMAIFYAENVKGGANTVTVSASLSGASLRFAVLEYSGVATSASSDGAVAAQGSTASPNSGSLTTTASGDLLLGGIMSADGRSFTAGSGYTILDRVPADPNTKLVSEQQIQTSAGPTTATASLNSTNNWGAILAAFRAGTSAPPVPDLTLTKTHSGSFAQGQNAAMYTLTVRNSGTGPTTGTVTVTDSLPAGLTATAISGTGWSCTLVALACTRSDVLAAGSSHPAISLTVSVANNAPANLINSASVSGGGESNTTNNTATDPTSITQLPDLTLTKTHSGSFTQGQTAASYTITVLNVGSGPTSGPVTVTDTLPSGLTATAFSGTGWSCTLVPLACMRSDVLAAGSTYPAISLTVSVANNTPANLTNSASVSGGGESNTTNNTATDPTLINQAPDLTLTKTHSGSFTQGQTAAIYTITVLNIGTGPTSGPVTVTDTLPVGLAAAAMSGTGWNCSLTQLNCTRSDALAGGGSYPAITVTVNVAGNAPGSIVNTAAASVSGDLNSGNNSTSDPTTITADTQAPAAPGNLGATGAIGSVSLVWTASTDNIGVAGYRIYRSTTSGFTPSPATLIGTTVAASYTDSNLPAGTYYYLVMAYDAAGNVSSPSNQATGTATTDTTPPTAPANPATTTSSTQINVSWTASTDNVGVTGYLVERCQGNGCTNFAQVGTPTAAPYSDTGLTASTSYSYRVRATDAAGNFSDYSSTASVTTAGAPTVITFVQGNYASPQSAQTSVPVKFNAAQAAGDLNVVAIGWHDTTASVKSVVDSSGNTYSLAVGPTRVSSSLSQSIYYAKNIVAATAGANTVTVTFTVAAKTADIRILEYNGADLNNPVDGTAAKTGLSTLSSSGAVTTTNASDLIFGANIVTTTSTGPGMGFTSRLLTSPDGDIAEDQAVSAIGSYTATAPLTSGRWIMQLVAFRTPADTTPPTAPGNLMATGSTGFMSLTWIASTDNIGVAGYRIYRSTTSGFAPSPSTLIATTAGTSYTDSGLATGTYYYLAAAYDAAGNTSNPSNQATGTAAADTSPPTPPASLAATPTSSLQINLSWTASTDNIAVTGYLVERCQGNGCSNFVQVGTPAATSYSDTGLTASTTYSYRVRATDAGGNFSSYSTTVSATTPAAPTVITYVQGNYATPQSAQSSVTVKFNSAQTAGDLNVVVVGWNDTTATVSSVVDSSGNAYTLAVGPTNISGTLSQSVYYSKNIAAAASGSNTVTVTFSTSAQSADIRVLEYQGADLNNPVDVTGANTGSGTASSSGAVTTTNPSDLIFGANIVTSDTTGPGAGFTSRLLTSPDGDIAEDQMVSKTGSYATTAPLTSGQWIMQLVAFRTPTLGDTSAPTAPGNLTSTVSTGSVSLAWVASNDNVGVIGYRVYRSTTSGFSPSLTTLIGTTPAVGYTDTGLANGTYYYLVTAYDAAGNVSSPSNQSTSAVGVLVSPNTSVLTPILTQQFLASGLSGTVTWSVDGVPGGAAATGTITPGGLYLPPAAAGIHTITAADAVQSATATVYVSNYPGTLTRDIDNQRTGLNPNETVLTPSNVNPAQFGKLFSYSIDGVSDASPLYVANVNIPGQGVHNVVYVATEHDSVYAFDADTAQTAPLWQVSFIDPTHKITTVPPNDTGEPLDIYPEIGITGSPVIDPSTGTLYVVAATKEVSGSNTTYVHRLHALDITTGAEKITPPGSTVPGPVVIQGSVPGTGAGTTGTQVPFISLHQNQRAALLLSNGVVYIAFASHGDVQPYHGWIFGYTASNLQQVMVFNTTPNGEGGGIWQSGDGLATDSSGDIFFVTGDGTFDANNNGSDYGDSIMRLSPSGVVRDYFSPHDQTSMDANDLDLGSGGTILLPDQGGSHPHIALAAGKNGTIYVVDRDNMGHFNSNNDNQIVQSLVNTFPNGTYTTGNFKAPVYWNGHLYFSADADFIKRFELTNAILSTTPSSQTSFVVNYPGATLGASSNGNTNGIVWVIERIDLDPMGQTGVRAPGILHAFDATNLGIELYNSKLADGTDALDYAAKWAAPLIANGKIFVATNSRLTAFGLLPNGR